VSEERNQTVAWRAFEDVFTQGNTELIEEL
jgi:hypothetical protein